MIDEDLIRGLLEKHFSEYKEYHLAFLVIIILLFALISIIQSIFVSKKLEKHKLELKKVELKFSVFNQLQIEALSNMFYLLTDFRDITVAISILEDKRPESYEQMAVEWIKKFWETTKKFSKEKYILPKDIKKQYLIMISDFETLRDFINKEKDYQSYFFTDEDGFVQPDGTMDELIRVEEKLKEYDRANVFKIAITDIEKLRREIELYFERM